MKVGANHQCAVKRGGGDSVPYIESVVEIRCRLSVSSFEEK